MTNPRVQLKKVPEAPISKQMLGMGLIVTAGLLIFLMVAFVVPKSTGLLEASRDYDTRIALPQSVSTILPTGVSVNDLVEKEKPSQPPVNLDLTRGFILSDQDHRIAKEFQIPDAIKKETAFWFDLYTKYPRTTWLIINNSSSPSIVEEWPVEKIATNLGEGPSTSKVISFLNNRMSMISRIQSGPLRIQQGLADDFQSQVGQMKRWMPAIEKVFKAQKLPIELTRLFLVPSNSSLGETVAPWETINPAYSTNYLLKTTVIDETRSPIKVARAFAAILKERHPKSLKWNSYFEGRSARDAAFEAALHAEAYWDELQLNLGTKKEPTNLKAFKLARATTIAELSQQLKTPMAKFFASNPDIIGKDKLAVLPKAYVFFVAR